MDIVEYLDKNGLWDPRQQGSRAGRSTLSQLIAHQDEIVKAMEEGYNMEVVYLDFAKAYDKVDHHLLLLKMRALGIGGNMGKWCGSFLLERTQQVKIGDKLSSNVTIQSSVPQGFGPRTNNVPDFCAEYGGEGPCQRIYLCG